MDPLLDSEKMLTNDKALKAASYSSQKWSAEVNSRPLVMNGLQWGMALEH